MTISAFPTPTPSRSQDQDTFDSAVEAFLTHLPTFVSEANATAAAMNLNSTTDTSASSVAIGTGAKTFTVSASKSFLGGMYVAIADAAAPSTNLMVASITSYSGTTLVVDVKYVLGSGTKTSWIISQSAPAADIAAQIHGATDKTAPVGADEIGIWDSVSGLINRMSFTNMLTWFAAKAGNASNVFSVAAASSAAHAVRSDQLSYNNSTFPLITYSDAYASTNNITHGGTLTVTTRTTKIGRLVIVEILVSDTVSLSSTAGTTAFSLEYVPAVGFASADCANLVTRADLGVGTGLTNGNFYPPTFTAGASQAVAFNLAYIAAS